VAAALVLLVGPQVGLLVGKEELDFNGLMAAFMLAVEAGVQVTQHRLLVVMAVAVKVV
jgi:hypothetical protein